jgi:glycosyl transferase family 25
MNFVISLSSAADRRKHIVNEFQKKSIKFQFFDAVNKDTVNLIGNKHNVYFSESKLTIGERACFLSHIELWVNLINSDLEYMGIFEDDVILSTEAHLILNDYGWIPKDIDLIKLEKFEDVALMGFNRKKVVGSKSLRVLAGKHLGTAGYVISKCIAKRLLTQVQSNIVETTIDELIFNKIISNKVEKVYQLNPCVVMQLDRLGISSLPSQLQAERSQRSNVNVKKELTLSEKIRREIIRQLDSVRRLFSRLYFN